MVLDAADLEKWTEDPEEWINTEESNNDAWEYGIRVSRLFRQLAQRLIHIRCHQPCAERVLMTLSTQYPDVVPNLIKASFDAIGGMLGGLDKLNN